MAVYILYYIIKKFSTRIDSLQFAYTQGLSTGDAIICLTWSAII